MRVVGEIPNEVCKITIFAWNNRYIIKLEQGLIEQTFKLNEYDLINESDLYKIVDAPFIQAAVKRFEDMNTSLSEALERA